MTTAGVAHGALGVKTPKQIGLFTKPLKVYGLPNDTLIFKGPNNAPHNLRAFLSKKTHNKSFFIKYHN